MPDAPDPPARPQPSGGWRQSAGNVSLPEVHGTVPMPVTANFWRKMMAFAGPGYLVAVGYMDPGNWATDLAGGSRYGYTLISVIMLSNLMAILLQALSARLGIVSGRDLAQACRDHFSPPVTFALWLLTMNGVFQLNRYASPLPCGLMKPRSPVRTLRRPMLPSCDS